MSNDLEEFMRELEILIVKLNDKVSYEKKEDKIPPEMLYAPLRSDVKAITELAEFARRILNPEDLGNQCSQDVKSAAKKALGISEEKK